jgi:hypothetical protein
VLDPTPAYGRERQTLQPTDVAAVSSIGPFMGFSEERQVLQHSYANITYNLLLLLLLLVRRLVCPWALPCCSLAAAPLSSTTCTSSVWRGGGPVAC